jgi:hypothetical protein
MGTFSFEDFKPLALNCKKLEHLKIQLPFEIQVECCDWLVQNGATKRLKSFSFHMMRYLPSFPLLIPFSSSHFLPSLFYFSSFSSSPSFFYLTPSLHSPHFFSLLSFFLSFFLFLSSYRNTQLASLFGNLEAFPSLEITHRVIPNRVKTVKELHLIEESPVTSLWGVQEPFLSLEKLRVVVTGERLDYPQGLLSRFPFLNRLQISRDILLVPSSFLSFQGCSPYLQKVVLSRFFVSNQVLFSLAEHCSGSLRSFTVEGALTEEEPSLPLPLTIGRSPRLNPRLIGLGGGLEEIKDEEGTRNGQEQNDVQRSEGMGGHTEVDPYISSSSSSSSSSRALSLGFRRLVSCCSLLETLEFPQGLVTTLDLLEMISSLNRLKSICFPGTEMTEEVIRALIQRSGVLPLRYVRFPQEMRNELRDEVLKAFPQMPRRNNTQH